MRAGHGRRPRALGAVIAACIAWHFGVYTGDGLEQAVKAEAEFLRRHLLRKD